mmetsp:Transcript_27263/g.53114  ORF Transcript_27263/g.53114 Transcript_27263/m.53114 type:complete len:84 (-) Transcript_27263:72-323(-)
MLSRPWQHRRMMMSNDDGDDDDDDDDDDAHARTCMRPCACDHDTANRFKNEPIHSNHWVLTATRAVIFAMMSGNIGTASVGMT